MVLVVAVDAVTETDRTVSQSVSQSINQSISQLIKTY